MVASLLVAWWGSRLGHAAPPARHARKHPVCASEPSPVEFRDLNGRMGVPRGLADVVLRPGLLRLQEDLCACLPRRRSLHPVSATAELRIQPNPGRVWVAWAVDAPLDKARLRLQRCLGAPAWEVEPLPHKTDMVVEGEPVEETIRYPLRFVLRPDDRS